MSHADVSKRPEGMARKNAREAVERETAARELQVKLKRIEILQTFSRRQFDRLGRSITGAFIWLVVFAVSIGVLSWYSKEIFEWALALIK